MQVSDILKEISDVTGWRQVQMAKRFRVSQGTISKWLSDQQSPNKDQWDVVQSVIRNDPRLQHLRFETETGSIAVMGRVGAGSIIDPDIEQVPEDGLYSVTLPFPVPADMIGFVIEGDSMYPKYEGGDVVVVYKDQRQAPSQYLGQLVVIRTEDGKRFLKKLFSGSRPDLYRLESFNAAPIHDVSVAWIGEVYASLPATQVFRAAAPEPKRGRTAKPRSAQK